MNLIPLSDMGGFYILVIFGLVYGVIAFIITVLVETFIMKNYYEFPFRNRLGYSLVMNLVSLGLGIPLLSFIENHENSGWGSSLFTYWYHILIPINWIIVSFLLTILIEFVCLGVLLTVFKHIRIDPFRKKPPVPVGTMTNGFWPAEETMHPLKDIFLFIFFANLASYAITFTIPLVIGYLLVIITRV